jgi:hypothetical protein
MIRPVNFSFNSETAVNNAFQVAGQDQDAQQKALAEFENFISILRSRGIDVTVVDDTAEPYTPDSVFPNNWISFHDDGTVCLYPMYARNRRLERKPGVIEAIKQKFDTGRTIDLSGFEKENLFLEGTGSMVLDRDHKIAYACLSARTDRSVLDEFCARMGYRSLPFTATDEAGQAIYHTNVMMCIADRYAVICLASIADEMERQVVRIALEKTGKEIIEISFSQMNQFAGNMLQVENDRGRKFLVMSSQAYRSLSPEQVKTLENYNQIIHSPLDTIERNGGGSARCMIAEIFLPANH